MMNSNNVLRQVTDIQMQCERIIASKDVLGQYQDLEKYSKEINNYLLLHVTDEFIVSHIRSIPKLNPNKTTEESIMIKFLLLVALLLTAGALSSHIHSRQKSEELKSQIHEMKNKYASLEFLLKNYF
ncbi:hypothetical protein [Flavobacterium sp.]|uniref:hypothetical protein n=1 Tax=Flavobacterium sp. TaxID=239 RepID=UPI002FDB5DE0